MRVRLFDLQLRAVVKVIICRFLFSIAYTLFPTPCLFPPGVAEGELQAGIDAGVAVSEGGAGDVNAVGAEVDGAAGVDEVVDADAALRGEVEDAGVGVGAVVLRVVGRATEGGVLVVGPDETAGGLSPEGEVTRADEVPAKDGGGDGGSDEGAKEDALCR